MANGTAAAAADANADANADAVCIVTLVHKYHPFVSLFRGSRIHKHQRII